MNFSLSEAALLLLVVSALVWLLASLSQLRSKDKAALRRVETRLDEVLRATGAEPIADNLAEVHEAIRRGETIRAIKAYREATGTSLVEAKQAVDRLTEGGSGR